MRNWTDVLDSLPRVVLAHLATPIHPLRNLSKYLNGPEIWIKRDDLTGLAGGGNKTRKLEYLVGDSIHKGADTLVTVGAIQSNHTRQTAAAAARSGMKCALLHCHWTNDAGPLYRKVGNILLSSILGAELYINEENRPIEDQGPLSAFVEFLRKNGHLPYLIPGGASDHPLGSMGYVNCALEIAKQSEESSVKFDYIVHCTGSSSTQSGLVAGIAAMGLDTKVIGISDDEEVNIKKERVKKLANEALLLLGAKKEIDDSAIEILPSSAESYGIANMDIFKAISILARTEGLIADPVYEGKAINGLINLVKQQRIEKNSRVLLMHLGGTPAVHAYANQFPAISMTPFDA